MLFVVPVVCQFDNTLLPISVETLGALGDGAVELLCDLGRRISEVTGERCATDFLLQRLISLALSFNVGMQQVCYALVNRFITCRSIS